MQVIILAAGIGRRLGDLTNDNTKCMVEVNGIKLIDRALDCLSQFEISRIIIVIGYKGEELKQYVGNKHYGTDIIYINNPIYDQTNNIYSLFLAKDLLKDEDTLLLESDLIYDKATIAKILNHPYSNIALVDKYESWMDGTVVTIDDNHNIKNFISKKHFDYLKINEYYKTVNIYKFSKDFSNSCYVPFLEAYCKALGNNEYYEQVLRVITLMDDSPIKALPLDGEKWYEIDDIQDLDIAQGMFAATDDEQWGAYTFRYGGYWRYPKLLDFCYLVNPYFPNTRMIEEMKASFSRLLREYPSGISVNSLLAAKNFSIKQDYVIVGNGAAELIKAYIENYVGRLGLTFPTFEEYPNRLSEKNVVCFTPINKDFSYDSENLTAFFENSDIDTLLLINPDNPSGNYISFENLIKLIEWTKVKGINFIVDESFVDFADIEGAYSLLNNDILSNNKHLVVIKSISKSYGVPGLRLGVLASGDMELIKKLKKNVSIWNINSFAEFYMQIYEKYEDEYKKSCGLFKKERIIFYNELQSINFLRIVPSQANYFLCEVIGGMKSRDLAVTLLKICGVLIKDCSGKLAFKGKQYIRIAIRNREDNHYLAEQMKKLNNV